MVRVPLRVAALGAVAALLTTAVASADPADDSDRGSAERRTLRLAPGPAAAPAQERGPARAYAAAAAGPVLKSGFPVDTHQESGTWKLGSSGVVVGDIDGDPELEVLVSGFGRGEIVAVEPDGTAIPGWPTSHAAFHEYLTLTEADPARPGLEVFQTEFGDNSAVTDGRGRLLPGWPRAEGNYGSEAGTAADLDGDGRDEVILNREDFDYIPFRHDGDVFAGSRWPQGTGNASQALAQPTIADLDADGSPEVIGGDWGSQSLDPKPSNIFAWHADGTLVDGWPIRSDGFDSVDRIVVGDVDGDREPEVVVEAGSAVDVLRADGSRQARWPVHDSSGAVAQLQHPALADLDEDGDQEIVVVTPDLVHVFRSDGSELPGFPVTMPKMQVGSFRDTLPVVGDLDNDGHQDIVVAGRSEDATLWYPFRVWAWSSSGALLPGLPLTLPLGTASFPAIADLDGNGRSDLVLAGGNENNLEGPSPGLYVFEYPAGTAALPAWSQYAGGPRHQGVPGQSLRPVAEPAAQPGSSAPLTPIGDLQPGSVGSDPRDLVVAGHRAYFTAATSALGRELWVTDGTPAGTHVVRDIRPGATSSRPDSLAVLGDRVFFAADDGSAGRELWSSDGTAGGTMRVADLLAGNRGSRPREVTVAGGKVFFTADVGAGREVWVSDGSTTPHVVIDWTRYPDEPGPWESSESRWLAAAGDRVVFLTRDGRDPEDRPEVALVGTDGTEAGTERLTPSWNLDASSWMHVIGGPTSDGQQIFVRADHRIIRTDGTLAGTTVDAWYEYSAHVFGEPSPSGQQALLAAQEGAEGVELYASEPGAARHHLVADLAPGGANGRPFSGAPADMVRAADRWVFSAHEPATGRELWVSDGTAPGTHRVTDLATGPADADPVPLVASGGRVLLRATGAGGDELWTTDGTSLGTARIADLAPGPRGSHPTDAVVLGEQILLVADDGSSGAELWSLPLTALVVAPSPGGADPPGPGASQAEPSPTAVVDLSPPSTRLVRAPRHRTSSRHAVFRFAAGEPGARFECRVDRAVWQPCSSPLVLRHLARRRHVVQIRAVDAAGNRDLTPATYRWRVIRRT